LTGYASTKLTLPLFQSVKIPRLHHHQPKFEIVEHQHTIHVIVCGVMDSIHLLHNYCTTSPRISIDTDGLPSAKLALITDYMKANLHQDLTLVELSAIDQISPYHFLRLFKKSLGVTPHQYILQRRIDRAKELLQFSDRSIGRSRSFFF
jgi:AraC-like DNA-binding protein